MADCSNVPILCMIKIRRNISSSLKCIANKFVKYDNVEVIIAK